MHLTSRTDRTLRPSAGLQLLANLAGYAACNGQTIGHFALRAMGTDQVASYLDGNICDAVELQCNLDTACSYELGGHPRRYLMTMLRSPSQPTEKAWHAETLANDQLFSRLFGNSQCHNMPYLKLRDGAELFYKDWGNSKGPIVVFSHGWPLSCDNWEIQMNFLGDAGYRVIGHDRRGHGRSTQTWHGNDMDTFVDDLLELFEHLDVRDAVIIGHSHGGGEVARFLGKHGTDRFKKAVIVGGVPPLLLKTESNPEGVEKSTFDSFRESMKKDRAQFFLDIPTGPFFGFNRPDAEPSEGQIRSWWQQGMTTSFKTAYDCIEDFSETDFTADLKKINIPVLVLHGDDDQVVPIEATGKKSAALLPQGKLKVYPGGSHALQNVNADEVNKDLLEFIRS